MENEIIDVSVSQIIEVLKSTHKNELWLEVYTLCGDDYMLLRRAIMEQLTGERRAFYRCTCQDIYNEVLAAVDVQNQPLRRTKW